MIGPGFVWTMLSLAIGSLPAFLPLWAVEACLALHLEGVEMEPQTLLENRIVILETQMDMLLKALRNVEKHLDAVVILLGAEEEKKDKLQ